MKSHTSYWIHYGIGALLLAACVPPGNPAATQTPGTAPALKTVTGQPFAQIKAMTLPGQAQEINGFMQLRVAWPENASGFKTQAIPVETQEIRIRIEAPDQQDLVYVLQRPPGSSTSQYRVFFVVLPAGSRRTITAEAFDSSNTMVAYGRKTGVFIGANTLNQVALELQPLSQASPTPTPNSGGGGGGGGGGAAPPAPAPTNNPPVISGLNQNLNIQGGNYSGTFEIVATDPENAALTYDWSVSGGTLQNNGSSTVNWEGPSGTYTVSVNVSDGVNTVPFSKEITLSPNQPPQIGNIASNMSFAGPFHAGNLTASNITDPEGDTLTYLWKVDGNPVGTLGSATAIQSTWTDVPSGNHVVSFQVSDGINTTSKSMTVNLPNQTPAITDIQISNLNEVTPGNHQANISVQASDPEGKTLSYSWSVNGGAINGSNTVNPISWQGGAGTHTVTVTVSDGEASTSFSKNFTVTDNQAPVISTVNTNITENPVNAFNGSLSVVASDPENQALSYTWGGVNSSILASTTGSSVNLNANTAPGTYQLTVTANDGALNSNTYPVTLNLVSANLPPTIQSISRNISFGNGQHSGNLTLSASDPENQTMNYTWSLVTQPGGATLGSSGNPVNFSGPEGTYKVRAVANDGVLNSTPFELTFTLTDPNNAPMVSGITDTGFNFSNGNHSSSLSPVATDADGDNLTYTWSTSGGQLSASTGNNVTFTAPAGTYNVTVQANDGQALSNAFVRQITLTDPNVKPVISGVTPNLSFNAGSGKFEGNVAVSASDADSDPLTYSWQVISGGSSLGANSGQSVNWSASPGTHTLRVIANDGTVDSDPFDFTTTLNANQNPSISGITVDYQNTIIYNGLYQRNMTVNATDPEGDPLSYVWSVVSGSPVGQFYLPATLPNINNTLNNTQQTVAYRSQGNIEYTLKVVVSDNQGNSSEFTKKVLNNNQVPYVSSTNYSVSCAGEGAYTVPVTISVLDPNGHAISNIQWSVNNGTLSGNTGTSNTWTIPGAGTSRLSITTADLYGSGTTHIDLSVGGCG